VSNWLALGGESAKTDGTIKSMKQVREVDELSPFFDLSGELLCVADLSGNVKRINPAWEKCLGWAMGELVAKPLVDLLHPDDRAAAVAEVGRLAKGGETNGFTNRVRGKDGVDRWIKWNARAWPERQVIYTVASDVTNQKRLESEILEASDREKERVGRELHDGLCQNLAGIAALSATLSRKLAARADPAAAGAAEIAELLNETIGNARDLARGLNPAGLEKRGLAAELDVLAQNVQALFGVACTFGCSHSFPRLDPSIEMHLYRIAQEAVNNATTHGRAKRIAVSLRARGGKARLRVQDDGVGIFRNAPATEGIGLHTMNYRAQLIGAVLKVQRLGPSGTTVTCTFSMQNEPISERRHAGKAT
jgi:PAS domain S-box-containing protein